MFTQAGVDCSTYNYTVPAISPSGSSLSLCTGGAVYLSVPATTANLDKLIWTRNGVEVARGQSYYIATQIGTYNVSMGAIGCNTNATNERKITESGTAPAQIKTIVASNSGILCGTSGTVKLTAMGSTGAVSWFHNGVLDSARTGSTITLTGSADQGDWFAAAGSAGCYSINSNVINVAYEAGSGTPIVVSNADVLVNGTAINAVTTFCQGGSLTLEVNNKQAGVTYTWYNGDVAITSPYTIPADQTSILLRMVATDNSGVACPAEASTTEKPISGGKAPDAPTISGSGVICKDSTDLSVVPAVAGTYTYTWYEGSTKLSQTTQTITVTKTGTTYSATVTNASGCVSPMGSKTTGAAISDVPTLTWKTAPTPVNFGEQKVYVTNIDYDLNTTYVWSVDGGATVTPAGASASVKFPATGTTGAIINLTVTATNSCGKSAPLVLPITVNNACPTPVVIAQSATTFPGGVAGTPVTLQVSATSINTPTYQWYTGVAPSGSAISGANSATYVYTPSAVGTVNLYCMVTNGCDVNAKGTSPAFTVTTTLDPQNYPTTASLSMSGKVCFDTRETYDNLASGSTNGSQINRTDISSPLPQGTQDYILTVTGKTISTVTWVTDVTKFYSNTAASGTNNTTYTVTFADLATIIKPAVQDGYKATAANGQVITITAYVNFTDGTKGSISKVIKIQDYVCCDGYICKGCAYDYNNGAPGDWALTVPASSLSDNGAVKSNTSMPNTSLSPTAGTYSVSGSILNNYFKSTPVGDLCFYKKNGALSYTVGAGWSAFIKSCQDGSGADGSAGVWYMPNTKEIYGLYAKLGGNGTTIYKTMGTPTDFGGAPDAEGIPYDKAYLSSTESNASGQIYAWITYFQDGRLANSNKNYSSTLFLRCVKRM
jgi:hypothetical protein